MTNSVCTKQWSVHRTKNTLNKKCWWLSSSISLDTSSLPTILEMGRYIISLNEGYIFASVRRASAVRWYTKCVASWHRPIAKLVSQKKIVVRGCAFTLWYVVYELKTKTIRRQVLHVLPLNLLTGMLQKLISSFPDPPLEEIDHGIMKACRESILSCLQYVHVVSEADNKNFIRLSETDRFIVRVSSHSLLSVMHVEIGVFTLQLRDRGFLP